MSLAIGESSTNKFDSTLLAREVQALVARLRPHVTVERRHDDRVAVPLLFRLIPLDRRGKPIHDDAITVVGKDISKRGLSFFHGQPLTYRRAIVSLEHPEFGRFAAELDINWCRFTRPGWYESGGRLVRSLTPQVPPPTQRPNVADWSQAASFIRDNC
jgi:hypothetical protein